MPLSLQEKVRNGHKKYTHLYFILLSYVEIMQKMKSFSKSPKSLKGSIYAVD